MHTNPSHLSLLVAVFAGALAGSALTLGLDALADGDPTTDTVPRMIPYQGQLEFNGDPVNTTVPVRVDLYYDREGGDPVFTQQLELDVYQGRFSTSFGPFGDNGASIAEVVSASDALYLGLTLTGDDPISDEDDVTMANRQQLQTSPHALWSRYAADFDVAGTLRVGAGRPTPGRARLELGDNVAEAGAMDDYNDFQLLLHQEPTPGQSTGLGAQPGSLFFNSPQGFTFYQGGSPLLTLGNGGSTLTGNLKVTGTFSYDGIFSSSSNCTRVGRDITDCYCPAGSVAISGGATAPGGNEIRESRYTTDGDRTGWRMGCGGPDAIGHCSNSHVMCAPVLP